MRTILLIEDNEEVRMVMSEVLEISDYEVVTAENGRQGIDLAQKIKPDLIVCDIMMPDIDGYGVINALQKDADTQSIPFIFLSALADRNDVRRGMELGADDYLTKPLSGPDELINAIESRLKKADLLKQNIPSGLEGLNDLVKTVGGEDILNKLTEEGNTRIYKKRQEIYKDGARPQYLFYIKKGKIKTFRTNDDGKELVTNIYTDGDFFGYNAIIEDSTYKEQAEAMEETEVAMVAKTDFKELLNSSREVLQKFIQLLSNNINERESHLLELAYSSLRKKVANTLISLCRKYKMTQGEQAAIKIGRENLANIIGTAKESVIRTLSDFKDEKLIDIKEGNIVILNESKLEKMLN